MACGVTRFGLVCDNSGTSTHAGLHTASATLQGRTLTWRWNSPATGQTIVNSDAAPAFHKAHAVGVADL